jgi:hypothetical protein
MRQAHEVGKGQTNQANGGSLEGLPLDRREGGTISDVPQNDKPTGTVPAARVLVQMRRGWSHVDGQDLAALHAVMNRPRPDLVPATVREDYRLRRLDPRLGDAKDHGDVGTLRQRRQRDLPRKMEPATSKQRNTCSHHDKAGPHIRAKGSTPGRKGNVCPKKSVVLREVQAGGMGRPHRSPERVGG